jgi:hypothetical protein
MSAFEGDYGFRTLEQPEGERALRRFSSGWGAHARSVNSLVRQIYRGIAVPQPRVFVMEDIKEPSRPRTMGVCAWFTSPLGDDPDEAGSDSDHCLQVIGVSRRYRGQILAAGVTLGAALLGAALEQVQLECAHIMPLVWARVASDNYRSHVLFDSHDFEAFEGRGHTIRFRGGGLDPTPFPLKPER